MTVAGDAGAKGSGDSDPLYFLLKRRWMTPYGTPVSRESCRGTEGQVLHECGICHAVCGVAIVGMGCV